MGAFLKKLIPNNIAGIIGVLQALIPLVRELIIVVIRILSIVMPSKVSEDMVVGTVKVMDVVEKVIEKIKDFFL